MSGPSAIARLSPVLALLAVTAGGGAGATAVSAEPDWDRVANVKAAAAQIGEIQKTRGVEAAYKFIGACYKTHGLASAYSKAFEGCIAQDYMQSRALALVYKRIPAQQLQTMGAPTADVVIETMKRRVGSALAQYKITASDGEAFLRVVETHGMPAFMGFVFPPRDAAEPKTAR